MTATNHIIVAAPFLGTVEKNLLSAAVRELGRAGVYFHITRGSIRDAHLLVVDTESKYGAQVLKVSRSGQVKLTFTSQPVPGTNMIAIPKPVDAAHLRIVLKRLFAKMQAQLDCTVPIEGAAPLAADDNDTLFDVLLRAKENGDALRINGRDFPVTFIDGASRTMVTPARLDTLRARVLTPPDQLTIERIPAAEFTRASHGLLTSPLSALLWTAGVLCSRGKLLPGHDTTTPVRLRAWPNFTRNDVTPDFMLMAAAFVRQPLTIDAAVELVRVPRETVVNFYNAAYAVDLAEFPDGSTVRSVTRRDVSEEKVNLFARIARRLRIG